MKKERKLTKDSSQHYFLFGVTENRAKNIYAPLCVGDVFDVTLFWRVVAA